MSAKWLFFVRFVISSPPLRLEEYSDTLEAYMHLSITLALGVESLVAKLPSRNSLRGDLTFIESTGKSWTTSRTVNRYSTLV